MIVFYPGHGVPEQVGGQRRGAGRGDRFREGVFIQMQRFPGSRWRTRKPHHQIRVRITGQGVLGRLIHTEVQPIAARQRMGSPSIKTVGRPL